MAKVKLSKNEQKKQKDALKRYMRYLPTLVLKKQQLQMVIRKVVEEISDKNQEILDVEESVRSWLPLFGENPSLSIGSSGEEGAGIESLIQIDRIEMEVGNIAGVDIPVFKGIEYLEVEYDLFVAPLWIDTGVELLKRMARLNGEMEVLSEQKRLLDSELLVTTQRVNLFEKVKIPETKENIRKIGIYLGDQQTASVVRGKIAKGKVAASGVAQ